MRALKAFDQPVQHWDAWLVTLICTQLDATTAGEWQLRQDSKDIPTYEMIESFFSRRVNAFSNGLIASNPVSEKATRGKSNNANTKSLFVRSDDKTYKCPVCSGAHKIYNLFRTETSVRLR